jgi:hypothetical protein
VEVNVERALVVYYVVILIVLTILAVDVIRGHVIMNALMKIRLKILEHHAVVAILGF